MVFLGPSGSGKTTALRCVAGLEMPDEGEIYIGDTVVSDLSPKERDVAMVFQSYALYPHMTVYDNIAFPLKIRGLSQADISARVKKVAELLRIERLLRRKPKQLSGGEQQRVALGRSIIRDPQVFLMDEPLSNLDAKLRIYMRAELKRLQQELQTTTIYVTHDQAEAMTMSDRIAIMDQGVLQQLATPQDIYRHPSNSFVAGFIGSPPMNFLDSKLIEMDGGFYLESPGLRHPIDRDLGIRIGKEASSSEVKLGVRPEHISVHKERRPDSFAAEVYLYEPLGSEGIVNLKVDALLIKAKVSGDVQFAVGEKVWGSVNEGRVHVFDKTSEKAII